MKDKKNNIKHRIVLLFGLLLVALIGISAAYTDPLEIILFRLSERNKSFPQEKLYLHIDRAYYAPGDVLWFKAYLTEATNHLPGGLSGVARVELISPKGTVVQRQKIALNKGFGKGDFELPSELVQGEYIIRAYTNWMRNFDNDLVFRKTITIIGSEPEQPEEAEETEDKVTLRFFPEGGDLVEGVLGNVAFEALDANGNPVDVEGRIEDQNGQKSATISTTHQGMGVLKLVPATGKKYRAVYSYDGKTYSADFPEARASGIVMRVTQNDDFITVTSQIAPASSTESFALLLQAGNVVRLTAKGQFRNGGFIVRLPKKGLTSGVHQITLFNAQGKPEAERLLFVQKRDGMNLSVEADKKNYVSREKVTLNITALDSAGQPLQGEFSLAVRNNDLLGKSADEVNIMNYLLLNADLPGIINAPGYYFDKSNPQASQALDILMMTHGWRRFLWKDIVDNNPAEINHLVEQGERMVVRGRVMEKVTEVPLADTTITMAIPGDPPIFYDTRTDASGEFVVPVDPFEGNSKIIIKVRGVPETEDLVTYSVDLNRTMGSDETRNAAVELPEMAQRYYKETNENEVIRKIYKGNVSPAYRSTRFEWDESTGSGMFIPVHNRRIILDEYEALPKMSEVFVELLEGARIRGKGDDVYIQMRDKVDSISTGYFTEFYREEPLRLINGVPVYDSKMIVDLPVSKVDSIDLCFGRFFFGDSWFKGVMSIHTQADNGLDQYTTYNYEKELSGFTSPREFYTVRHERKNQGRIPDFRPLLYWSNSVQTDENGRAVVEFYTSDDMAEFEVDLQGISTEGKLGVAKTSFRVGQRYN